MATYTVTAFKWTGTYYNATYNTSHEATFTDNDGAYQGSADSDEQVSIDGGAAGSTSGSPYVIKINFTDPDGNAHVEEFNFFNTGGAWYFAPGPGSAFVEGSKLGSYKSHYTGWNYADVACFAAGTRILTARGAIPVERLRPGDEIPDRDGTRATLQLVLRKKLPPLALMANPRLRPVRIAQGALGCGLPRRALTVSPQHRLLIRSPIARRMFGTPQVLVPARRLVGLPGISVDPGPGGVTYFHLVFEEHRIVLAEDAPAESLLLAPGGLAGLTEEARAEIASLFPDALTDGHTPVPAGFIPPGKRLKQLISRHRRNGKPPIMAA